MIYFETPRLIFRDWKKQDLYEFQIMNRDPEVMKYYPALLSEEETKAFYNRIITEFTDYGYGLYAVEAKDDNSFIGIIGFHRATFEASFTPCIEIGWRLKYEAWGKGYATEGAKACLKYGFDKLGFNKVYSFTSNINIPSQNVMKKIGMVKVMEFEHPKVPEGNALRRHVLYSTN
ncbi:GNAT family N-acetyltransferase [Alloiococcus sp. CFN-8]|uniref:GNAT family N-acetyltransferase n=1 Tax=Alloiococcus sp. CFN-8 TaxID=3416081 RepID=UPI003CF97780